MIINGIDYQIKSTVVTPPFSPGSFGLVTTRVVVEEQGTGRELRFTFEQKRGNMTDSDIAASSQAMAIDAIARDLDRVLEKQLDDEGFRVVEH